MGALRATWAGAATVEMVVPVVDQIWAVLDLDLMGAAAATAGDVDGPMKQVVPAAVYPQLRPEWLARLVWRSESGGDGAAVERRDCHSGRVDGDERALRSPGRHGDVA